MSYNNDNWWSEIMDIRTNRRIATRNRLDLIGKIAYNTSSESKDIMKLIEDDELYSDMIDEALRSDVIHEMDVVELSEWAVIRKQRSLKL